ncbi:MAG TPA: 3'-5' exonuclease [Gaiellales bacterium]|jgi:DNA polymerase-3 subunit epsilon|nr:3'-5' exonuclease [Gaiellales bacterium]HVI38169.1 3'-5' exonuclease [Gaiellales bacterium]
MRRRSWRDAALLCVDIELTGLDPKTDEVIAFGAVPLDGGRIRAAGAIQGMVKPTAGRRTGPVAIHGILPQDLDSAPPLGEALVPLAEAIRGRTPIAHAAWVERAFLGPALRKAGGRLPRGIIDTAMLWRLHGVVADGSDPGYNPLQTVTDQLALPSHHPHQAIGDALTTAQVFLALATRLERLGHGTLADLLHAERRVARHHHFPGHA